MTSLFFPNLLHAETDSCALFTTLFFSLSNNKIVHFFFYFPPLTINYFEITATYFYFVLLCSTIRNLNYLIHLASQVSEGRAHATNSCSRGGLVLVLAAIMTAATMVV